MASVAYACVRAAQQDEQHDGADLNGDGKHDVGLT
jgi:hypothetical protein